LARPLPVGRSAGSARSRLTAQSRGVRFSCARRDGEGLPPG
jgi:hypothetical protein